MGRLPTVIAAARTARRQMEFDRSPVVEVALAVAFQPIAGLRAVELGLLWGQHFKEEFPQVQEQPRVEMAIESFGAPRSGSGFSFKVIDTPLVPRLWFLNKDETELIQIQNDWFARNWRQLESGAAYPHYDSVRESFISDLSAVLAFAESRGLGEFIPTQCELSYTNHVPLGEDGVEGLRDVLSVFEQEWNDLNGPESASLGLRWLIRREEEPIGRLHVDVQPAIRRSDGQSLAVLTITARGRPLSGNLEGVLAFLDLGHDHAVETFLGLTRAEMQKIWGMKA